MSFFFVTLFTSCFLLSSHPLTPDMRVLVGFASMALNKLRLFCSPVCSFSRLPCAVRPFFLRVAFVVMLFVLSHSYFFVSTPFPPYSTSTPPTYYYPTDVCMLFPSTPLSLSHMHTYSSPYLPHPSCFPFTTHLCPPHSSRHPFFIVHKILKLLKK